MRRLSPLLPLLLLAACKAKITVKIDDTGAAPDPDPPTGSGTTTPDPGDSGTPVYVDTTPPSVRCPSLVGGELEMSGTPTVSVMFADDSLTTDLFTTIWLDDSWMLEQWVSPGGTVNYTIPVAARGIDPTHTYTLAVSAVDAALNQTTIDCTFIGVDRIGPTIEVISPEYGARSWTAPTFEAYVMDSWSLETRLSLRVEMPMVWHETLTPEISGYVTTTLPLHGETVHTISLVATDEAGNDTSISWQWEERLNPGILSPTDGASFPAYQPISFDVGAPYLSLLGPVSWSIINSAGNRVSLGEESSFTTALTEEGVMTVELTWSLSDGTEGTDTVNITILPAADTDGDGMSSGAGDCDDADPTVTEALAYVPDLDLDGHGDDAAAPLLLCGAAPGYVLAPGDDCNDNDARAYPGAPELCGYGDEDCAGAGPAQDDGAIDMKSWYPDNDHDGYGDSVAVVACSGPSAFYTQVTGDCDDAEATFYPGAPESCDVTDDTNCDGSSGADDLDGDGFTACEECDDRTALIKPSATETCATMGIDDNCDGSMDAGARDTTTFWADQDEDGFGDPAASIEACETPAGYVSTYYDVDCDDTNNAAFPGSSEFCDGSGADNNCDGVGDDGAVDIRTFAPDADGDLFPAEDLDVESCDLTMAGHLELSRGAAVIRDCDDAHAEAYPGGVEVCDGLDNDCANSVDDLEMDAHEIAGDDSEGLAWDYEHFSSWTPLTIDGTEWLIAESADLTLDSGDADWFKWDADDVLDPNSDESSTLQIDVRGVAGDYLLTLWEGPDENTATARLVQEYTGVADSTGIVPDLSFTEGGQSGDDAAADGPYWFLRIESIPAGWQCTDPFSTYSVQISYY